LDVAAEAPELRNIPLLAERGHMGIKKGLENIRALLQALGNPQDNFPVVLIGGTNGKGSTGAFLAHMLRASGLVVGWTTSPHFLHPRERIWVDGEPIGEGALDLLLGEAFEAEGRAGVKATYFELMITAALSAFRMTGVEVALLEVGMGGRWDATNATEPMLSIITSVGMDHQQHLGWTREAIGREKLCISRDGHSLVLGPSLDPEWARPLLEKHPRLCPVPRLVAERLAFGETTVQGHPVPLGGLHQLDNLATAFEAVRQLSAFGFPIREERLWEGVAATRWPGRIWKVPGLENVWMDGAHNVDGARVLVDHAISCGLRPHLLVGAMEDKDLGAVAKEFLRLPPRSLTFVRGDAQRYATFDQLFEAFGQDAPGLTVREAAQHLRAPSAEPRLVTGSLYLLGDLLAELGVDPWA
jgi:dihydrofolate synthase/folylpolyglutamate synthase